MSSRRQRGAFENRISSFAAPATHVKPAARIHTRKLLTLFRHFRGERRCRSPPNPSSGLSERLGNAVFSMPSLLVKRLEISQRALRSLHRTELNSRPLGLSKMKSPLSHSVARSSTALLQYLRTSQLRTRNAASTSAHCIASAPKSVPSTALLCSSCAAGLTETIRRSYARLQRRRLHRF